MALIINIRKHLMQFVEILFQALRLLFSLRFVYRDRVFQLLADFFFVCDVLLEILDLPILLLLNHPQRLLLHIKFFLLVHQFDFDFGFGNFLDV